MKSHGSYNSIPELAGLSEQEQTEIWEKCSGKHWRHWQTWFAAVLIFCICVASGTIVGMKYDGIRRHLFSGFISFVGGLIWLKANVWIIRVRIREYLISHEKTN
jgi:hypothetical protein